MQHSRQRRTRRDQGDHLKKDISLTCLLANESTGKVRRILEEMGAKDSKNHAQLEYNLAEVYKTSENKAELEKKLAEIHPHKEFILKYLGQPTVNPTAEDVQRELKKEIKDAELPSYTTEQFHNCSGCSGCSQKMSNACGNYSAFDGNTKQVENQPKQTESNLMTIGIISIVAISIFGLAMVAKSVSK